MNKTGFNLDSYTDIPSGCTKALYHIELQRFYDFHFQIGSISPSFNGFFH